MGGENGTGHCPVDPVMPLTASARLVYLAGSGRSGSTLVERSLGAVPGWVNVGELIDLFRKPTITNELCGCGMAFLQCEFWSAVGQQAFGDWSPAVIAQMSQLQLQVSRQRFLPRLFMADPSSDAAFSRRLREYGGCFDALYEAIAAVAGADVIVDASKWPGQGLALRRSLRRPVSLLHVVRDPRGVALSCAKSEWRRPHDRTGTSVMASHTATVTARRWLGIQSEIELMSGQFDYSSRLRHEDFVADPEGELRRVTAELGAPATPAQLSHAQSGSVLLGPTHGLAGNPARFDHGRISLREDDNWVEQLPDRQRRVVTAITAPLLARYRYPLSPTGTGYRTASGSGASTAEVEPRNWPPVDVVVPTRGRPDLVREAVSSIVDQDYPGELHIVVVHDAEDPQQELAQLSRPGRRITLTINSHRPGLAGSRNTGLEFSSAELVASCDDDDTWDIEKLRRQVTRMLAEPDLVVLGTGMRQLMTLDHVVDWPGDSPVVTKEQLVRKRRKELHSSTLLIRRSVFEAVGGYDEALPGGYAEDYEFLLRAIGVGRIGVINEPLASIRRYNTSWFRDRAEVVVEALEYLLAKHPEITESPAGHARVLGQIAFARSTLGHRQAAVVTAGRALRRWPLAPHAALALTHAATGIDPRVLLGVVQKTGRGIT